MLNVSTLLGVRTARSDALRYGMARPGEIVPAAATARRPVVVWNSTRACNLTCAHCYASARRLPFPDELTTEEARALLDDLVAFEVPAVLLSGGEPLARDDALELIEYAIDRGLRLTLSSNGTLIDDRVATALARAGVTYVGISIDGAEETHDRLRRLPGARHAAIDGLRALHRAGVKRGVRYTLTPDNAHDLPAVLDLVLDEDIERFCMYHLAPAGRGAQLHDITPAERRDALRAVFAFAGQHPEVEVLTVDNPSDGVLLHRFLLDHDPITARRCRDALAWNRGGAGGPGVALACVDERGDVHPDQFSRHRTLGSVRDRPFSDIWTDPDDPFVVTLRSPERPVPLPCRDCPGLELCGGGLRSRAEAYSGDPWGFDPACSLQVG